MKEILNMDAEQRHHYFVIQPCSLDDMDNLRNVLSEFVEKFALEEEDEQEGYNRV